MKPTPPGKLFKCALELSRSVTLEELFKKTDLPLSWLRKFRQREISSPSVQRVEALIVAMTGKELL